MMNTPQQPYPLRALERHGVVAPMALKKVHQARHNNNEGEEPHQASPRQSTTSTSIGKQNDMSNSNAAVAQNNETTSPAAEAKKPEPMLVEAKLSEERTSGKPNVGIDIEVKMAPTPEKTRGEKALDVAGKVGIIGGGVFGGLVLFEGSKLLAKAVSGWFGGDVDAG